MDPGPGGLLPGVGCAFAHLVWRRAALLWSLAGAAFFCLIFASSTWLTQSQYTTRQAGVIVADEVVVRKGNGEAIRRSCHNRSTLARNSSCSKHGAPGSLFSWTIAPAAGFDAIVLSAVIKASQRRRRRAQTRTTTSTITGSNIFPRAANRVRCLSGFTGLRLHPLSPPPPPPEELA